MIEKIKMAKYGGAFTIEQLIKELALKQDEIIEKVNELELKIEATKLNKE